MHSPHPSYYSHPIVMYFCKSLKINSGVAFVTQ